MKARHVRAFLHIDVGCHPARAKPYFLTRQIPQQCRHARSVTIGHLFDDAEQLGRIEKLLQKRPNGTRCRVLLERVARCKPNGNNGGTSIAICSASRTRRDIFARLCFHVATKYHGRRTCFWDTRYHDALQQPSWHARCQRGVTATSKVFF